MGSHPNDPGMLPCPAGNWNFGNGRGIRRAQGPGRDERHKMQLVSATNHPYAVADQGGGRAASFYRHHYFDKISTTLRRDDADRSSSEVAALFAKDRLVYDAAKK
mmetsp:Transcript_22842/g.49738  ORF Transcript_22842/g.49738 Transcript_22842/m.49738 type:complete len:105 (+) Transcript_22842:246-560(+)